MELCPGGAPTLWDGSDLKRAFVALSRVKKTDTEEKART